MFDVTRKAMNEAGAARVNIDTKIASIDTILSSKENTDQKISQLTSLNKELTSEYDKLLKNRSKMFFLVRLVLWFLEDASVSEKVTKEIAKVSEYLQKNPLTATRTEQKGEGHKPEEKPVQEPMRIIPEVKDEPIKPKEAEQPVVMDELDEAEAEMARLHAKERRDVAERNAKQQATPLGLRKEHETPVAPQHESSKGVFSRLVGAVKEMVTPAQPERKGLLEETSTTKTPMQPMKGAQADAAERFKGALAATDEEQDVKANAFANERDKIFKNKEYGKYYEAVEDMLNNFKGFSVSQLQFFINKVEEAQQNGQDKYTGDALVQEIRELIKKAQ